MGKYVSMGLDVLLLGAIVAIMPGAIIGGILHKLYPSIPTILWMGFIGFAAGWGAKQFDPQGKSVLTWTVDVLLYLKRKHITDGYKPLALIQKPTLHKFAFYAVDQGTAYATPIAGKGTFTLHKPLGAKVLKDGTWVLRRSTHPLEPGKYKVQDGKIKRAVSMPPLPNRSDL